MLCPFNLGRAASLRRGDAGVELVVAVLLDGVVGMAKDEDSVLIDEEDEASPPITLALLLAAKFELAE